MKTIQDYRTRNQFDDELNLHAENAKGDKVDWSTPVKSELSELDPSEIDQIIKESLKSTIGEVTSLDWNITEGLRK